MSLKPKRVLRTEIMPSLCLKTFEINTGIQSFVMEFKVANKQFSFIEISLVYDKSDQHNTFYDSYNVEIAAAKIGSLKLENANNNYSILSEIEFDLSNKNVWYTKGCSVATLTEYANNDVYRELPRLRNVYDLKKSDERLYIDLRRSQGYTGELEKINRNNSNLPLRHCY